MDILRILLVGYDGDITVNKGDKLIVIKYIDILTPQYLLALYKQL